MFIIAVFRLCSDEHVCCLFYCIASMDQSWDVTPRLGEGGWFLFFDCWSPFWFLLVEFYYVFSHLLYIADMSCLLILYLIWFQHALLLFLQRISTVLSQCDQSRDVTLRLEVFVISHGMWRLAWEFLWSVTGCGASLGSFFILQCTS